MATLVLKIVQTFTQAPKGKRLLADQAMQLRTAEEAIRRAERAHLLSLRRLVAKQQRLLRLVAEVGIKPSSRDLARIADLEGISGRWMRRRRIGKRE